jgi:hypothetical protein
VIWLYFPCKIWTSYRSDAGWNIPDADGCQRGGFLKVWIKSQAQSN